ncbi:MAG: AAA family ATPase, partial [Deltaproteobacteria bacterium]
MSPVAGETTVRGVVQSVVFQSPDGKFSVVRLLGLDGRETRVIGDLGALVEGEQVRVTGRMENNPTRGPQLRASVLVPELPSTTKGIQSLLGSGFVDGIGPAMAERIVSRFGSATLDIIADHPERLREIAGIGKGRAKKIKTAFHARRAESEARAFLQAAGFGPSLAQKVIRAYGDQTPAIVRQDPYRLAREIHGVGFRTADAIALQIGIPKDAPSRAAGAVLHLVNEASDQGHTALPRDALRRSAEMYEVPDERVLEALDHLAEKRHLVLDGDLVYAPPLHRAETFLARRLGEINRDGVPPISAKALSSPTVASALAPLNVEQRSAVQALVDAQLLVLTGGPGTGKTTTVRAIVALVSAAKLTIALASPTGRAARRLSEATGKPASTIHRLLEWNPRLARFNRDETSPLEADVVLVDEASMLDVVLASRIVAALKVGARLVFVGDADQLPSVGPGTVLADLLATPWVRAVRLTEVFRQAAASAIIRAAHDILNGRVPEGSAPRAKGTREPPRGELFRVVCEDAEQAAELLVRTVAERIPESFGLDPMRDVQVLVPTHKGPLGAVALNRALQRVLNPLPAGEPPLP